MIVVWDPIESQLGRWVPLQNEFRNTLLDNVTMTSSSFANDLVPISIRFQCITSRVDLTEWCQIGVLFKFQGATEFPPNLFLKYLFVYAFMRTIEWILFGRYKSWNRWIKCTNWHYYYTLARWKWKENIWRDDICLVSVLPTFAYKRLTYWIQPNRSSPIEFGCC